MAYGDERILQVAQGMGRKRSQQGEALLDNSYMPDTGDAAYLEQEEQDADKVKSNAKAEVSPGAIDPKYWDQPTLRSEVEGIDLYKSARPPATKQNTFTGLADPRLAEVNKALAAKLKAALNAGETDDTGRYPGGAGASDAFERGFDQRQGQQMVDNGSHVFAEYTDPRTGERKKVNYTSRDTNAAADLAPNAYNDPTQRASQLGTEGGDADHQMLAMRSSGQQDPYGGNVRPVKTVNNPGASMIQGTPEQQRELTYEKLGEENAIAERQYQQDYLRMSPQERAQTEAQRKAAADPRMMAQQNIIAIHQEGSQRAQAHVRQYAKTHPNATPEELKREHDSVYRQYGQLIQGIQGIFSNKQTYESEYPGPPSPDQPAREPDYQ